MLSTASVQAQKMSKTFGSSISKKIGPKTLRVPYTDVVSYLGYAAPGEEDETKNGKKYHYLWVPAVAPEIGVRMKSQVKGAKYNKKKATVSQAYSDNSKSKDYFDTYITIERSDIMSIDGITEQSVKDANWVTLAQNDYSSEMPTLPNGSRYNSLIRYKSQVSNPLKALIVGLYRIGFTTYKTGQVKGSFIAQVSSPVKLPEVGIAKTVDELLKQIKK